MMQRESEYLVQLLEIEFTDQDSIVHHEVFQENTPYDDLPSITMKMAFLIECHLTDNAADFSKPITIKYTPLNKQPK